MTDNSYAEYWNVIMQSPDFDFVSDIRGLKYGRLYSIYELFEEWEYSDERLAILRLCYTKKVITDKDIQEWKDWHKEEEEEEEDDDDEEISDSTIITGVVCTKCNATLPPHTCEQHLDINNPIHKCPHIQCECCDNEATESFDGIPSCKTCYDNGIEYLRSQGADI